MSGVEVVLTLNDAGGGHHSLELSPDQASELQALITRALQVE